MRTRALAIAALTLLPALPAHSAEGEPITLVTPLVYGTQLPGLGQPALELAKLVKERSGGSLVLDLKQPGEGVEPQDILDKVSEGSVDAGFATASFWAARLPAASLFSGFPFGPDGRTYLAWFDDGNGRRLYQEMYDQAGIKVHVLPCAFGGAEAGGWFAKEIKSKKDIKGLRMRIFGLGASVVAELGAKTVLVSGSGLADAFARHEIDAAELYTPAVDRLEGLQDKVKLIYMPGWHQPETVLEFLINQDRWTALSGEQREAIEGACKALLNSSLAESASLQAEALSALAQDGVRIENWPEDVLAALHEAWDKVADEEGGHDYFFKTVLNDIDEFRAQSSGSAAQEAAPAAQATP
jgi:TRAP-type mannitol/chloroaromatic compound transport system substrate-binding protein